MKIGTLIHMEHKDLQTEEMNKYRCKIIEKNNQGLITDYPINVKNNKTSFLPIGSNITITYVDKDQAVYEFESIILKKIKSNIPALVIQYPEKNQVKRFQRREFVRIETTLDVATQSPTQVFKPFTTVSIDISGGGMSIIIPDEAIFSNGEHIQMFIVLPLSTSDYHYISVDAEVVFIKTLKNNICTASLKFTKIADKDQQFIIRYCFEKQRKERQKEIQ